MPRSTARAMPIAAAEHEAQATSKALGGLAEALVRTRAAFDEAQSQARGLRPPCLNSPRSRG